MAKIDSLIDCLINLKRQQHFRAFWSNQDQASSDMVRGRVGIESLWSPAMTDLKKRNIQGRTLHATYDYLNW